ncbi:hypothetical protein ACTVH1_17475 [Gluconobacter cerinus]
MRNTGTHDKAMALLTGLPLRTHIAILVSHLHDGTVVQSKPFVTHITRDRGSFTIPDAAGFGRDGASAKNLVFRGEFGDTGIMMNDFPGGSGVTGIRLVRPVRRGEDPQEVLRGVMRDMPEVAREYAEAYNQHQRDMQKIVEDFSDDAQMSPGGMMP